MADTKNYGPKRLVVGAHYGVTDFIAQRITAVILAVYTLVLIVGLLIMPAFTYENWKALFTFHVFALPVGQILASPAFFGLACLDRRARHLDGLCPPGRRAPAAAGADHPLAGRFGRLLRANPLENLSRGRCHEFLAAPPV